jgi:hypothetical protein
MTIDGRDSGSSLYIVRSNPVPGREEEYHDWYSRQHLPQLLAVPGFASAQRFVLSPVARGAARLIAGELSTGPASPRMRPSRYTNIAIYEITGDPRLAFDALDRARRAGAITPPAAIAGEIAAHVFAPITGRMLPAQR